MMQKQVLVFFLNEDEYITSYLTKIALHHWGFKIIGNAKSEKEAIYILNTELPDLIIMDITSGINPYEIKITKTLKKLNIPIIYLVSYENEYLIEIDIMKDCTYGIVPKPIDVNVLYSEINSVLTLPAIEGRKVFSENNRFPKHSSI